MGASLLQAVAALVSRLQPAARQMARASSPSGSGAAVAVAWKKALASVPVPTSPARARNRRKEAGKDVVGLWKWEILMGERCQPLDFSGVIYYDAEGRRLPHPPPPHSPMRSPLPASPKVAAASASRLGGARAPTLLAVA